MCRRMGSHLADWIEYNGVSFNGVTSLGLHIFGFLGVRQFFIFTVCKCTRMFTFQMKSKVFFIQSKKWVNS